MNHYQKIRGIAFDLDGTLIDSSLGLSQAVDGALYALELPAPGESLVETWIGNGVDVLLQRAFHWALKGAEPSVEQQRMARRLFDRFYAETASEGSFLFPQVQETLQHLREAGLPLAVVTNKPTPFVQPLLDELNMGDLFEVIIGGDDVKQKKPHPEAILQVLSRFGMTADELLFVGDSRNDIQAAHAAGCRCVGLTYGYNYGEAIELSKPDVVCEQFGQLLPLLGLPPLVNQESAHE